MDSSMKQLAGIVSSQMCYSDSIYQLGTHVSHTMHRAV